MTCPHCGSTEAHNVLWLQVQRVALGTCTHCHARYSQAYPIPFMKERARASDEIENATTLNK